MAGSPSAMGPHRPISLKWDAGHILNIEMLQATTVPGKDIVWPLCWLYLSTWYIEYGFCNQRWSSWVISVSVDFVILPRHRLDSSISDKGTALERNTFSRHRKNQNNNWGDNTRTGELGENNTSSFTQSIWEHLLWLKVFSGLDNFPRAVWDQGRRRHIFQGPGNVNNVVRHLKSKSDLRWKHKVIGFWNQKVLFSREQIVVTQCDQ